MTVNGSSHAYRKSKDEFFLMQKNQVCDLKRYLTGLEQGFFFMHLKFTIQVF